MTNTGVTIIAVVRDVLLREDRVRELFRGLHRLYVDAACSPLLGGLGVSVGGLGGGGGAGGGGGPAGAALGEERLTSPSFEEAVTRLVEASNGQIEYRGPVPL